MSDFNLFIPFDSIEKSVDEKTGKTVMKIGGVISNSLTGPDADGEVLDVEGMDFSSFLDRGFINYSHLSAKDPSTIIGEPTKVYTKGGKAYMEGILYPESEMAKKVYDLANTLNKSSSSRKLGYSIEGKSVSRDPLNPKRISKSSISGLAVTPMPKCQGTELTIIKGEVEYELQKDSQFLIDITDEKGTRWTVDQNLNIEKAMVAGDITGTETTNQPLTQQPLKEESVEGGKKKKKKDYVKLLENLRKRRGDSPLSKAEVLTFLSGEFDMDRESCERVFSLAEKIEKAGEGSRGGKIIGHTKSGKPVYDSGASHSSYSSFTQDDHTDAESLHVKRALKHGDKSKQTEQSAPSASKTHASLKEKHRQFSIEHQKKRFS